MHSSRRITTRTVQYGPRFQGMTGVTGGANYSRESYASSAKLGYMMITLGIVTAIGFSIKWVWTQEIVIYYPFFIVGGGVAVILGCVFVKVGKTGLKVLSQTEGVVVTPDEGNGLDHQEYGEDYRTTGYNDSIDQQNHHQPTFAISRRDVNVIHPSQNTPGSTDIPPSSVPAPPPMYSPPAYTAAYPPMQTGQPPPQAPPEMEAPPSYENVMENPSLYKQTVQDR